MCACACGGEAVRVRVRVSVRAEVCVGAMRYSLRCKTVL